MLRISRIESSAGDVILRLEGKLIGPWVNELKSCCAVVCKEGRRLSLDMTDVLFVDRRGLALLRSLQESNVALTCCTPLLSDELSRP
jgi:ABC-type transporter Mla MlaB component